MASTVAFRPVTSHVRATRGAQEAKQITSVRPSDSSACLRSSFPVLKVSFPRAPARGMRQGVVRNAVTEEKVLVEKVEWKDKRDALLKNKVRSVSAKEALEMQKRGSVILDVRPLAEFEEGHPQGAVNAAMYRLIKEWTAWDILRRAGFAFFGIFNGTEENPDFVQEVEALGLKKDSELIVACGGVGTMKPSTNFPLGKESRSLIAAYVLSARGFKKVVHMEGGVGSWFRENLPAE